MKMPEIFMKVVLDEGAIMPTRAHEFDAGLDLYTQKDILLNPCSMVVVDTGVHIQIPQYFVGFIKSRSGLMAKNEICAGEGTIDCDYTGSIKVMLFNHSREYRYLKSGDRIAQLVITPCILPKLVKFESLEETERGDCGLGSTGR